MTEGYGAPVRLGPGSKVAGYLIEEQIGAGGMAIVYRARDEVLGRAVALKVMSPALAADQEFRARFLRESRSIATVDDPHIVPVYAAGEAGGVLYIATRFVPGGDLAALAARSGGFLPPERAASFIAQVASALDAAHAAGLVHRDVKLANVLVDTAPGRPEHAYLSDFGLTKDASGATGLTATGQFMGTPDYCAPEQITGGRVDGRTDQYALGCAAFTLLTGSLPYVRPQPVATLFAHINDPVPHLSAVRPGILPAVDAVVARAMAKDPAARYASCGEFAGALQDAVSGRLAAPTPPSGGYTPAYAPTQFARSPGSAPGSAPGWASNPPAAASFPPAAEIPQASPTPPAPGFVPAAGVAPAPSYGPAGGYGTAPGYGSAAGWGPAAGTAPAPSYPQAGGYAAAPATGYAPAPGYGAAPGTAGYPQGPGYQQGPGSPQAPGYGPVPAYSQASGYSQAPGYPPPPQGTFPPGNARGKSRGKAPIIIGVAAVVVLGGAGVGVALSLSPRHSTPNGPGSPTGLASISGITPGVTLRAAGYDSFVGAFSADGKTLATEEFNTKTAADGFFIWNATTGQRIKTLALPTNYAVASAPAFSADGTTITALALNSVSTPTTVQVYRWNLSTGSRTTVFSKSSPAKNWYAAYQTTSLSGDGSKLTIADPDGSSTDVYDVATGNEIVALANPGSATVIGNYIDYRGDEVAVSDNSGATYIFNATSGVQTSLVNYTYKAPAKDTIAEFPGITPDGTKAFMYAPTSTILWDVASGKTITPDTAHWPQQADMIFSNDGRYIATTTSKDSTAVDLWNGGGLSHILTEPFPAGVQELPETFSQDDSELVTVGVTKSGGDTGTLYVWHLH